MIASMEEQAGSFIAPTFTYTVDDQHKISVGSMLYHGKREANLEHFDIPII